MVKIANKLFLNKKIEKTIETLFALFGLYLLIQMLKAILGGSWNIEDIILGLLVLILGSIFTMGMMLAQLRSDHNHLKGQFKSLANDFKSHVKKRK